MKVNMDLESWKNKVKLSPNDLEKTSSIRIKFY